MPAKKLIPISLVTIHQRKIKGYAFMKYPMDDVIKTPEDYAESVQQIISHDLATMSEADFRSKYTHYIY